MRSYCKGKLEVFFMSSYTCESDKIGPNNNNSHWSFFLTLSTDTEGIFYSNQPVTRGLLLLTVY